MGEKVARGILGIYMYAYLRKTIMALSYVPDIYAEHVIYDVQYLCMMEKGGQHIKPYLFGL